MSNPPNRLLSKLKVAAPRHMAKKKSLRSAPRIVSGRESDRCTLLIRLASATCFSFKTCVIQLPGKSHDKKFTAAMAIPTPNSTPASTRFEPPSPKANVRPATTMATSERPRAMVLVNAVMRTLTAFSQGELPAPCAYAGAATSSPAINVANAAMGRRAILSRRFSRRSNFISVCLLHLVSVARVLGSSRRYRDGPDRGREAETAGLLGCTLAVVKAHTEHLLHSGGFHNRVRFGPC